MAVPPDVESMTCSDASLALGEPIAGTASVATGHLLLEHGGPWAPQALEDTALPPGLGEALRTRCAAVGLTPLLVRRPGAPHGAPARPAVVVAVPDGLGLAVTRRLDGLDDVLSVDLPDVVAQARRGVVPPGWDVDPWLLAVCTHGRRDACCAALGRPVAARLAGLAPEKVWETSHLGGHRLAAGVLALPSGVLYGRVPVAWAEHVMTAVASGRVLVDLVRGRSRYAPAEQVAELALRRTVDEDREVFVVLEDVEAVETGDATSRSVSTWTAAGGTWRVVVDSAASGAPARQASCGAAPTAAPPEHTVVEVTDVEDAGRGAQGWDEAHGDPDREPGEPHPLVVTETEALAPGTAIDLACGTGRHALWLAGRGWDVTAVDFSRTGLRVGERTAVARGLEIDWQLGDARVWTPPHEGYDLVLMAFVHLPAVLARAVRWLRPGGRLVVVGHARRNLTDGVGGPRDPRLLHDVVDLAARATGARLRVLRASEVERPVDGGVAVDAVLVAERPRPAQPAR